MIIPSIAAGSSFLVYNKSVRNINKKMDNKKISTHVGAAMLVIIAITVGMFVWTYEKEQNWDTDMVIAQPKVVSKEIRKEDESDIEFDKKVSFCGKVYKTNGAMVGGVDFIQRIAVIVAKDNKEHVCENITNSNLNSDTLLVRVKQSSPGDADYNSAVYYIQVGNVLFKIDTSSKYIYVLGGFDGEPTYIGAY